MEPVSMPYWSILAIIAAVFFVLVAVQVLVKSKRPVRKAISGVFTGIAALLSVNLAGIFTGVTLPVSLLSLGVAAVVGIPGVTLLLLLQALMR